MNNVIIRTANFSDIPDIAQLFDDTIRSINSKDYPQDEIDDWAYWATDADKWKERISHQYFIVAILNNIIVGFSSLAQDGYLDFMYVHKNYQRKGIAKFLLKVVEEKAILQKNEIIYSDVSITARPFFEKYGYIVEKQQLKKSKNKELINYKMIKYL